MGIEGPILNCGSCLRYRLVLVMIDGKRYLVGKNEMVPEGCTIIRTREGGSICGV